MDVLIHIHMCGIANTGYDHCRARQTNTNPAIFTHICTHTHTQIALYIWTGIYLYAANEKYNHVCVHLLMYAMIFGAWWWINKNISTPNAHTGNGIYRRVFRQCVSLPIWTYVCSVLATQYRWHFLVCTPHSSSIRPTGMFICGHIRSQDQCTLSMRPRQWCRSS